MMLRTIKWLLLLFSQLVGCMIVCLSVFSARNASPSCFCPPLLVFVFLFLHLISWQSRQSVHSFNRCIFSPFCSCPSSPWSPGKATVYWFDRSVIHYPQLPLPILFPSLLSLISWSRWTLILAFPCPCLSSCPSCPPRLVLGLDLHLQNTLRKDVEFGVKSGIEMQWSGL